MPELPEVETMVRGIRPQVEKSRIELVEFCPCPRKPIIHSPVIDEICPRVAGQKIVEVSRLAKRVVLKLESSDRFVIEPRMTGLMLLEDPPTVEHLRFHWQLKRSRQQFSLWFWDRRGLGTLRLYTAQEFENLQHSGKLGPDALSITVEQWQQRLQKTNRPIKVALLDQKLVSGIGNLYASEILHVIQVSPHLPASQLKWKQIEKLHAATQQVLNLAIQYEGSTLSDGTYRNALNKNGGYQNEHRVYDKEGKTCRTCLKGKIERIVQAQRSTFYCPRCQKG